MVQKDHPLYLRAWQGGGALARLSARQGRDPVIPAPGAIYSPGIGWESYDERQQNT
jgi:hypothetical protein